MHDPELGPETRRAALWEAAEARKVPLRAILAAVGVVVAVYLTGRLIYTLREVLLLLTVAGFVALLLNPLVVFLQRKWLHRRGTAVGVVVAVAVLVFASLAFAFGYPLVNGLSNLASNLPHYVSQAEHGKGWIGHLVQKYHVQHWVQQNAPKIASFAKSLSKPALSLGKGALTLMVALFAVFMLVVLLLLEGPRMREGVFRLMAPQRANRVSRVAGEVSRSVTGYMLGNFITSIVAGAVVFVTLMALGVPYAVLWALWVALVDFLPMIGGALAGIPTVLFALTHSLTAGIVTGVVFLLYTQVENHVLNPVVMSRTVRINPLLVLIAILVGVNLGSLVGGVFGGFVGTLLAVPVAASLQVIVREVWRTSAPAPELPEPEGPPPFDPVSAPTGPAGGLPADRPGEGVAGGAGPGGGLGGGVEALP